MWSGLIRRWNLAERAYDTLTVSIEDTDQPGWLLKVCEGQTVIAEILADSIQSAMAQAVKAIQVRWRDPFITQESLTWLQVEEKPSAAPGVAAERT